MEEDPASSNKILPTKSLRKERSLSGKLKNEWQMFWDGLVGEESSTKDLNDPFITGKLKSLTLDQVKEISKTLSYDRRKLNQKIEDLKKEIEMNTETLENLKLVGSDSQETLRRINELTDLGQSLNDQLYRLNERLHWARRRQDELKKEPSV